MTTPRGIRNNNPLNIDYSPRNHWKGKLPKAENTDSRFEQFIAPEFGIRAGAVLIRNHYRKRGADTIWKLIHIWAPPTDEAPEDNNPTAEYARFVADEAGYGVHETVDLRQFETMEPTVRAMIQFEQGQQPYSRELIREALDLAGVRP